MVNLRVADRVSYPDVTVDLGEHQHVVVGLENGGGKSSLLGFLVHVFLLHADQFLPRLAHRRQNKEGEERRIEHYVPGGAPTHVVVELELPGGGRVGPPGRAVVGACLHKPAGADRNTKADGFFWSARCVADELRLPNLGIRDSDGRLIDHQAWRNRLAQLRGQYPGAEINYFDRQGDWGQHLWDALRVDVDFVRTWLLAMNVDEGAADHVFTYASSGFPKQPHRRGRPSGSGRGPKKSDLVVMGERAKTYQLDRRRAALLTDLVGRTGPLAQAKKDLVGIEHERAATARTVLAAQECFRIWGPLREHAVELADREAEQAEKDLRDATTAYNNALTRETLGREQLAQLRLQATAHELEEHRQARTAAEGRERHNEVAAVLVRRAVRDRKGGTTSPGPGGSRGRAGAPRRLLGGPGVAGPP